MLRSILPDLWDQRRRVTSCATVSPARASFRRETELFRRSDRDENARSKLRRGSASRDFPVPFDGQQMLHNRGESYPSWFAASTPNCFVTDEVLMCRSR